MQVADDDVDRLAALTGGDFFDVVFDATGNALAMERGFRFIAHGGKYVLISIVPVLVTNSAMPPGRSRAIERAMK